MALPRTSRLTSAVCAVVGGSVWALTPLRQPLLGAGGDPQDGVATFVLYNLLLLGVATAMFVALREAHERWPDPQPTWLDRGWSATVVGTLLLAITSLLAAVLGGLSRDTALVVSDLGFLAAVLAMLGAVPMGVTGLRHRLLPRAAGWLFAVAAPVGIVLLVALAALGVSEDVLGLPLTVLYGAAFVALGLPWLGATDRRSGAPVS